MHGWIAHAYVPIWVGRGGDRFRSGFVDLGGETLCVVLGRVSPQGDQ